MVIYFLPSGEIKIEISNLKEDVCLLFCFVDLLISKGVTKGIYICLYKKVKKMK